MPDLTAALLDRMIRTIVDEVDPEQVILFGSRARGDARPDSDVDLLIIESQPFGDGRSARAESARLNQALAATPVATDLLVYSREEIDRWRGSLNHLAACALREGRVLYARDWGVPSPTSRPCSVRDGDQPQPDIQQARLLLGMADGDLDALRVMHNPDDVTDEIFGFHVQQAAEKCFKAWIAMLGEEYPLTHDLGKLIEAIRQRDATVTQHAALKAFSAFAVNCRYVPLPEGWAHRPSGGESAGGSAAATGAAPASGLGGVVYAVALRLQEFPSTSPRVTLRPECSAVRQA